MGRRAGRRDELNHMWDLDLDDLSRTLSERMPHMSRPIPVDAEQHAADWSCWVGRTGKGWQVCWNSTLLDVCLTREQARVKIREYKANPDLAAVAEVQFL